MLKLTKVAMALAAVAFSAGSVSVAQAQETAQPSFNYVSGTVHQVDLDGEKLNGFGIDFGFDVTEQVFAEVQYFDVGDSYGEYFGATYVEADLDVQQLYANLGYKIFEQDGTAIYLSAGFAYAKATYDISGFGSESFDDNGYNVQMGIRHRFNQQFEVDANMRHYDMGDDVNDQEFALTGRYYINNEFSLLLGYTAAGDDVSYTRVGATWHF
ncbi:porin family protein [Pseudidiomarina woesei]|uniref:Opacity protein and related surface antigens n=1 Tax=Pseudidiomarina woesei TaxID=1381080 RepID=A0A0K6H6U1_9GAMM|nr:porin family protein [Pseudidiomarina woesei]CUA86467.1 Opacity protein and related surface antigens [Pseudidiomarina woesei]